MRVQNLRSALASLGESAAEALRACTRASQALVGGGLYARPLSFERDRVVILFFEDVERDALVKGDRHLRRAARQVKRALGGGQLVSGFGVAVDRLVKALERKGYCVRLNDARLARRNPGYPIGISGYPHILDGWKLANPALLGPGLLDHPGLRPELMNDPRFRSYAVSSSWTQALFEKRWPGRTFICFAGVDLERWPDLAGASKDIDLLIYEKFLWTKEASRKELLEPILAELRRRGLRIHHLRYGRYQYEEYRAALARSRGMLFLCEHETQGIAYQEAMASNVPILAWDQAKWLDPLRLRFGESDVAASSVPWFSPECGERFRDLEGFGPALDAFLMNLQRYRPRDYVAAHLSLEKCAEAYLEPYARLAAEPVAVSPL